MNAVLAKVSPADLLGTMRRLLLRHRWLLLAMLPFAVYWIAEHARYVTMPDALFGGDMWAQLGITRHIADGHAPWTDAYFQGEWAFRDWLLYTVVAGVSKATGVDPMQVAIFAPVTFVLGGGIVTYALGRRLFAHDVIAVMMAVAWMGFSPFVEYKTSAFAAMLTVPLFVLALATQDGSMRRRVWLGLAWGLASLSYLVAFFGTSLMLLAVFLHRALGRPLPVRDRDGWRLRIDGPSRSASWTRCASSCPSASWRCPSSSRSGGRSSSCTRATCSTRATSTATAAAAGAPGKP